MPSFDIVKETEIQEKSFRVAQLYDQFDLKDNSIKEHFSGNIELPEDWNVGVIVGKSGTGKTTIAKELFAEGFCQPKYKAKSVIDDFPKEAETKEVFSVLSSVGFSSPPSWLKPYEVLSNGEKMRVDLAMAILQKKEIILFDEYTSVVDREVAQIGSLAVQKAVRRAGKKFIAVTCHYDVLNWLEPDWVFNTDTMEYQYTRGRLRRPEINLEIYEHKGCWPMFSKYHYLNHDHVKNAREFICLYNGKPVSFVSFIHFPSAKYKTMVKGHRLVTLPDYQGIGIAKQFLNIVAKELSKTNEFVGFTSSLNGFAQSFMRNKEWTAIHIGRKSKQRRFLHMNKHGSQSRNTYSFRYTPKREAAANV